MEANKIDVAEKVSANKKLQRADAEALLAKASTMTVAKGKKVQEFKAGKGASEEAITAMLGSTGNLRAPTMVVGKTLLVGFNEDAFKQHLT